MIVPSPHAPPRKPLASHSVVGGPPRAEIRISLSSLANATHRPSGEKNGHDAPFVLGRGCASNWSS